MEVPFGEGRKQRKASLEATRFDTRIEKKRIGAGKNLEGNFRNRWELKSLFVIFSRNEWEKMAIDD
jgi:hypothetical protein